MRKPVASRSRSVAFKPSKHQIAVVAEEVVSARMAAQIAFRGVPADACRCAPPPRGLRLSHATETVSAIAHAVHGAIGIGEALSLHRHLPRLRAWRFGLGGDAARAIF